MNRRKPIDLRELEKLCAIHATYTEIAQWFCVSQRTLDNRVAETKLYKHDGEDLTVRQIMDRGYARGRVSLRRKQVQLAEAGNPTMLVWLGKQILGQRDAWTGEITGKNGRPLLDLAAVRAFVEKDHGPDE